MSEQVTAAILVHGFLDAGDVWTEVVGAAGDAGRTWGRPDLDGMGERWEDGGPFTLQRYADHIVSLIDQTDGSLVLVGHSMGAQVVELAARQRAQRVAGLVLISPIPLGGSHASAEMIGPLAASGEDIELQREIRRKLLAPGTSEHVLDRLTPLGQRVKRGVTKALVAAWNDGVEEGRERSVFEGPVLILSGDADGFVTPAMLVAIAARFAHSATQLLMDVGHWPQAEAPAAVAGALVDFMAQVSEQPRHGPPGGGWMRAFGDRSARSFGDDFAEDVRFEATTLMRAVAGRERVQAIMEAASHQYRSLTFTHRTHDGDRTYLEWDATLQDDAPVAGVTVLTTGADGKIVRIAIHHRPMPMALRFSAGLRRQLSGIIEPDFFFDAATDPPPSA
jgi:pimeloyl-ACP methyl ester carboxylesterase